MTNLFLKRIFREGSFSPITCFQYKNKRSQWLTRGLRVCLTVHLSVLLDQTANQTTFSLVVIITLHFTLHLSKWSNDNHLVFHFNSKPRMHKFTTVRALFGSSTKLYIHVVSNKKPTVLEKLINFIFNSISVLHILCSPSFWSVDVFHHRYFVDYFPSLEQKRQNQFSFLYDDCIQAFYSWKGTTIIALVK